MSNNVDITDYVTKQLTQSIAETMDKEIMKLMYMSTSAPVGGTAATSSINLPSVYGASGYINTNMNNYSYPSITSGTSINMNGGILTTDNTGGLSWNGNSVAIHNSKASISRIHEMLNNEMMRQIILCKTREECQEKYGSYGLNMFESMLNEVLQTAIKSEEAFNGQLQAERDRFEKFRQAVVAEFGDSSTFQSFMISNYICL